MIAALESARGHIVYDAAKGCIALDHAVDGGPVDEISQRFADL
jgi:hypothetical protein